MKNFLSALAVSAALVLSFQGGALAAKVGEPAPDFTGKGSDGKSYHLADLKGSWVVLEWHNQGCPFVKKFYGAGEMQKLQKEWTGKGVKWFTVLSSAPGSQGAISPNQENAYMKEKKATPTAALMDANGTIAKAYEAKTTPHMFVIDPKGTLVYNGAIDDKATPDSADITAAKNYVSAALTEGMAGKAITVASSRPYGCSVKYK